MHAASSLAVILVSLLAASATAQVLTPAEAFGGSMPKRGRPGMYLEPMSPSSRYEVNCSPSRASLIFASAIRTGAAQVWMARGGEYAVIWRRGQSSYRAVQLIQNRYGRVGQKTIGKHLYRTLDEAADAIAEHAQGAKMLLARR
jgi:hypothetical protein